MFHAQIAPPKLSVAYLCKQCANLPIISISNHKRRSQPFRRGWDLSKICEQPFCRCRAYDLCRAHSARTFSLTCIFVASCAVKTNLNLLYDFARRRVCAAVFCAATETTIIRGTPRFYFPNYCRLCRGPTSSTVLQFIVAPVARVSSTLVVFIGV